MDSKTEVEGFELQAGDILMDEDGVALGSLTAGLKNVLVKRPFVRRVR